MDRRYPAYAAIALIMLAAFFAKGGVFSGGHRSTARNTQEKSAITPAFPANNAQPSATEDTPAIPPASSPESTTNTHRQNKPKDAKDGVNFPGFPIDINTATREELLLLPGVGPKTADRIIETRAEMRGFKRIEDLMEVKGIGEKKLSRVKGLVTVGKGR